MTHDTRSLRKPALLTGCALGAVLALLPEAASAQALQGTPTTVAGTATITTGVDFTQVVPNTAEVVINWAPFDTAGAGTIDFLPTGATAEFAEVSGTFDYTVLNRILPADAFGNPVSRAVAFNGTVTSRIGNFPGGNIWFYSPTGIIAGPTAVFNVGSLLLTTNNIPFVPAGGGPGSIYGPGGLVQLQGPAGSTGFVQIQDGAEITATGSPFGAGYVALVAPRVVQGGRVEANGPIGYLAAEQVDMTINGGLFDFVITVGTTDPEGIVHQATGVTTGPATTSAADLQRISLVALPKNDAMTMMLAGSIGYTPAASAANEGSAVVLAAGFGTDDPTVVPANRLGSAEIGNGTFSNALTGYATDAIDVLPTGGGTTSFQSEATLYAVNSIDLTAAASTSISAASTLALRAGQPGAGGTIDLSAIGTGQITAAGGFDLDAGSAAAAYDAVTPFVDAIGGAINLLADGGTISTPADFFANVGATGGDDPSLGGLGDGGTIDVQLANGGTIGSATMTLTALGRGGTSATTGGLGTGGTVAVTENGGLLDLGDLGLYAHGAGGDATTQAGDGVAGSVSIDLLGQAQDWDNLVMDALAVAGLPFDPAGVSGHASSAPDAVRLTVAGPASLTVQVGAELSADARSGIEVVPGFGAQAGGVTVEALGGGSIASPSIDLHADAFIDFDAPDIVPLNAPTQLGGLVNVLADGGSIETPTLSASATASGHEATLAAGTATGGTVEVLSLNGGTITVDDGLGAGTLTLVADAYGAAGPEAANAFGGSARLAVEDGSISVASDSELSATAAVAEAAAATAGGGFTATGGSAGVELLAGTLGTGSITTGTLAVRANGDARLFFGVPLPGGEPIQGNGGDGLGGSASLLSEAGTLSATTVLLEATGTGGASASDAANAFVSGDGIGGIAQFTADGGSATLTTLRLHALGQGGGGAPGATGAQLAALAGVGTGGDAVLRINGGALTTTDTELRAIGTGASGMNHAGAGAATAGGTGAGGNAQLQMPVAGNGSFTSASLSLLANGRGGDGGTSVSGPDGNGGDSTGQSATATLADGAFALGTVTIEAIGIGGDSGDSGSGVAGAAGGQGSGGAAAFALVDSSAGPAGPRTVGNLAIEASGRGGLGSVAAGQSAIGEVDLTVSVRDPASALGFTGGLSILAGGSAAMTNSGISAVISGAPLQVGADIVMSTAAPLAVTANEALRAAGAATLSGSTVSTSGLIQSGANMVVTGAQGISAGRLTAGGSLAVESDGGDVATGDLTAGTWSYVDAFGSATVGNVVAGNDVGVTTRGGNLTAGNVTAGDDLWLSVFGTDPASQIASGDLVSTGLGVDAASAPPELFAGPGPAGNVIRVHAPGALALGAVRTPGRAILVADGGGIDAGLMDAPEGVIVLGRGDIGLGGASTAGKFYVADSAMFLPNLPDAYDPASLDGLTPVDTSGSLTIAGPVTAGTVSIAVGANVTATEITSGGTTLLRATGGAIVAQSLRSTGPVTVTAQSVDIASPGALAFADLDATAGNLAVVTAGNLTLATADAAGDSTLRSTAGALTASGPINAGGASRLEGFTGVTLPVVTSGGDLVIEATNGQIDIAELLTFRGVTARARGIDIASTGSLFFPEATATAGDVLLLARGELVTGAVSASGLADLRTSNDYMRAIGNVTAGTIRMTAFDRIEAAANLVSAGTLTVDAGASFILDGSARGTTISVLSSDIALGDAASIGQRGLTGDLALANRAATATTFIGGAAQTGGYSLDSAEAARLFADRSITVTALGDVALGDLALTFGGTGNIGSGGQLEISTPMAIAITGDVALRTSGADDTFLIDPTRVELDSSTGSIALLDAGGTPLGGLQIVGDTIAVASTGALAQLRTLTDMAAINALLDTPGGAGLPLRAGSVSLTADDGLFVQNSGATTAFDDRRGFEAGTLDIATGASATRIVVNGQILTAGGPVSGLATAPLIRINGAVPATGGPFDPASTINGCVIGGDCSPPPEPDRPEFFPPTSEDIENPIPQAEGADPLFVAPLVELVGTEPLITPPLVDEPITGVGNDDLWEPRCDIVDDDATCPEGDGER